METESNPLDYFPTFDQWLFMKAEIDAILPSFEHAQWLEEQKPNTAKLAAPPPGWTPVNWMSQADMNGQYGIGPKAEEEDDEDGA